MKFRKAEKGQILYILALAMIALLGFTALAIDGTNVYNDRRKDQSTADSAALAGAGSAARYLQVAGTAGFDCATINTSGTLAYNAALQARSLATATATDDNVALANNDLSTKNGVKTTCGVSNGVPYIDIHTMVSSSVNTYFLKVITHEPTKTSVEAIARVYVSSSYANGNGLVALGTNCTTGGIHALGNAQIKITGAGVYSADCIEATGSSKLLSYGGLIQYTGINGLQLGYSTLVLNDLNLSDPITINPGLTPQSAQNAALLPKQATQTLTPMDIPAMDAITPPACNSYYNSKTVATGTGDTVYPGTYSKLSFTSNSGGNLLMKRGIYCFDGPLSIGGGPGSVTIESGSTLYFRTAAAGGLSNGGSNSIVLNGTTIYITQGDYNPHQLTWGADNSKVYIAKGNFVVDGGVSSATLNHSSVYLNNGSFNIGSGATFTAVDITVYIKQSGGTSVKAVNIDGAAKVTMLAPGCNTSACGVGPAQYGVLFNLDKNNSSSVNFVAGSSSSLGGTVYAPASDVIFSGGTTTSSLNVQIIGKKIDSSGGGVLTMDTTKSAFYSQGAMTIELQK